LGAIAIKNQPCPDQVKCRSSDGMQVYEGGDGFCFVCQNFWKKEEVDGAPTKGNSVDEVEGFKRVKKQISLAEIHELPVKGFQKRGIPRDICEFFGIRVSFDGKGEIDQHFYPYGEGYNVRVVADKKFYTVGRKSELCGQEKFSAGGKRLIITEGEIDMLSIAYASKRKWDRIYPVVTMGSASNIELLAQNREWIRSYDEVVLWMDSDKAGKAALEKAVRIIGFDKVKVAKHSEFKDANEVHLKAGWENILKPVFDAERVKPGGIISRKDLKERMRLLNSVVALPYPDCMAGVNSKAKGMRFGEITLFTSGTGSGKSTLLREIILEIKRTAPLEHKIGICALEESPEAEARRMSGMQLNRNTAREELDFETLEQGFDELFGTEDEEERILMLDHEGSMNDTSIIDKIEYMCLMGCRYILIDHITILVSEGIDNLQGNEAQDKIMNALLSIVKRYPVWIGLVSHLRKVGQGQTSFEEGKLPSMDDIKGSGSIKQISFDIIAFARNMNAAEEKTRNTIKMAVLKCRTVGLTGRCIGAIYDYETGRLTAADDDSLSDSDEGFSKGGSTEKLETTWVKK